MSQRAPILSLDVPSGIDTGSGTVYEPAIRATATMTLALPKRGLGLPGTEALVGELYLAEGKKRERLWQSAATAMQKLGVPQSRIDHLLAQRKPELVAQVVKELEGKK